MFKVPLTVYGVVALASVTGCSLLVSLDGLNDPNAKSMDASSDASTAGADANEDGVAGDATLDAGGDAGAWAFIASDAVTTTTPPAVVMTSAVIKVGDLVIVGCDANIDAGDLYMKSSATDALAFNLDGPNSDGASFQAEIGWVVITQPLADVLTVTITPQSAANTAFIDCTINVYRGGSPNVSEVDYDKQIDPTGATNVSCGPTATVAGGLAYYIAARTPCAGTPLDPRFNQRQLINGHPNGDVVPTDGSSVQTMLTDCQSSTSDWICSMLSLSP